MAPPFCPLRGRGTFKPQHTMDKIKPTRPCRPRGPRMKLGPIEAAQLAADYYHGDMEVGEIARRYNVSYKTLYKTLRRYGYMLPADEGWANRRESNP